MGKSSLRKLILSVFDPWSLIWAKVASAEMGKSSLRKLI
jgi:hypothetical protein